MPFTTGIVTNTRDFGTASSNIVVSMKNESLVDTATVVILVFASVDSSSFVPAYAESFTLVPNETEITTYFISGNVAYEVQYDVILPALNNVIISVFGIDEFGNLVQDQRYSPSEFMFIPDLSPLS
ncbi:hypothetical protein [Paenibacillus sp. OV219]|uniref:hypothetical protein n=1 Tax=Paenibacillus sp. OV219 TaxID=1884377 RepID=UPI0008D6A240|nr:hypothetical protein [Paenibacillus sp. OV219]SEO75299.1 hypothetical protein SAMN05518847_110134 [Paenibacillus sp. OV219]